MSMRTGEATGGSTWPCTAAIVTIAAATELAEPVPRDWWTASDVATFLGIAPSTIRAYVARGQMPAADSGPHAATICG
jgi:hypothetical protein